MAIQAPRLHDNYPDRFIDCQMAIEDGVLQLLGDAQIAGWSRAEVRTAILALIAANLAGVLGDEI